MQNFRLILAVLLLLAFGSGTPVLSAQAGDMAQPVIEATADHLALTDCRACGGEDMAMPPSACFGICSGVQATTPRSGATFAVTATDFVLRPEQRFKGFTSPPDPFPPKLTILA